MLRPLGGSAPAPPPATTSPRAASGRVEDPQDQVTLGGGEVAPQAPKVAEPVAAAPAAPPAPPPIVQQEAPFYRAAMLPGLHEVEAQLRDGKFEGAAFQQAAMRLSKANEDETDPFVARKIQQVLYERVQGTTAVADWQLKRGMLDGPLDFLGGKVDSLPRNDHNYFTDEVFLPFLDAVAAATAQGPVPERALKTVAHLATSLWERSEQPLNEEIRSKETPEDDRRWSEECVIVLDEWHARGGVQVVRGGETLPPGSVDLLAELSKGRAAVRGKTLDLTPPSAPMAVSPEAASTVEALLEDFKYWEKEGCPQADQLQDLARAKPELAREVVQALLDRDDLLEDRDASPRIGRLVSEAATRPGLKELLRPHLPRLTSVAARAHERGTVAPDNLVGQYKVKLYQSVLQTFPELATEDFVRRDLAPLLLAEEINTAHDAARMMLEVWKEHPDLVGPTMDVVLQDSTTRLGRAAEELTLPALEKHGWSPTPKQQDAMLAELYLPVGKNDRSVFTSYETVQRGLGSLEALEARSPGYLDRLRLPDTRGQLVPARRAMLDRLLNDPSDDLVRNLYTKSSGSHIASRFYKVIFPNAELTGELLDRVAAAFDPATGVAGMSPDAQAAAAVLGSVPLSKEDEARLDALLAPEIPKRQKGFYVYSGLVESVRARFLDREAAKLPGLPGPERVARAEELLTLARETHEDYDAEPGRVLKLLVPHLAGADLAPLVETVRADLARGQALESLSPAETARLQLADAAAPEGLVLAALRPRLRDEVGYGNKAVESVMHRWRWSESLKALESPATPLGRRGEALELGLFEAGDRDGYRKMVLEALARGLEGVERGWLRKLRDRFPDADSQLQAFRTVAGGAETDAVAERGWSRFSEVLDRVGKLDDAGKVWPSWERNLAQGIERAEALRIAMLEHALGGEVAEPPREIARAKSTVTIGGIELPVQGPGAG